MKSVTKHLIFIIILFATVATKATFKVHSHSGSWCDYETGLGKVNIQVIQEGQASGKASFNMTLVDDDENKYSARCSIDSHKGKPEPEEPEDKENESEKPDIDDIESKENEGEEPDKESLDGDIEKEEKESIDEDIEKESLEGEIEEDKDEDEDEDKDKDKDEDEEEDKDEDEDKDKDKDKDEDEDNEKKEEEDEINDDVDSKTKDSGRRIRLLKKKNLKAKLVKKRKLEEKHMSGVCYFDPPKQSNNLYYEKDSLILDPETKDEVVVEEDFYVIAQKCLSAEQAQKQLNIHISFRQLNKFKQVGDVITFYFFGLTTEKYEAGFTIEFYIYLILANGKKEKKEKKVTCSLEEATNPTKFAPVQADFKCKIDGLKEKYSSLEFHRSDFIAGVPKEEVYLNPYLTYLAILKGIILDYSLPKNKKKVPSVFVTESIKDSNCETKGTFKINGVIGAEITEMKKVRIPLTFPSGVEAVCKLPPTEAQGKVEMECKFGGELTKQSIIIEQRIIKDGNEEIFTFDGAKSDPLTCTNGELKASEQKLNVKLSFRQVNKFKQVGGKISFSFFGLVTQKLEIGFKIEIWLFLLLPGGKREKTERKATCQLLDNISPKSGQQLQADFSCEIGDLDSSITYLSFEISYSEDFAGLPNNKILLDPEKTRKAIENGELDDFSLPENKNKVPILFETTGVSETTCLSNGEFIISGNVNAEIEKDLEFILPVSYPEGLESKCTLSKSNKKEVEMLCVLGGVLSDQSLVFEQQIVREGLKEIFTLESIKSDPFSCSQGDISIGNTTEEEDNSTKVSSDKSSSDKTSSDKSSSDKTSSDKSQGDKSGSDKTSSDKSQGGKDASDKSHVKDPSDKSHGGKDASDKSKGGENSNSTSTSSDKSSSKGISDDDDENLSDEEAIKKDDEKALEEAEKKIKVSLSFRQLNLYNQQADFTITFYFFGLTTKKLEKGFEFPMYVNLILLTGEREEEETEAICVLEEDASPEDGQAVQADFKCTITSAKQKYYSFRFKRSDYIAGIPTDETLLDPVLTAEAIKRGELLDYSLPENKVKIPALFNSESINSDKCKAEGTFTIQGSLSKELENDLKFKVPLSYPSGIELSCSLAKGEKEILCKLDREVEDKVMLEQTIIKEGLVEVLLLGKVSTDGNIQCSNAMLLEAEEKAKVKISFRQCSHFVKNGSNGFNFFLASFVSQKLVVNYEIKIKIFIIIKGTKTEKEATCKLQSAVDPGENTSTQGDFLCEGKVEEEEYKEIDFTDSQSVTVSPENEEIVGVSDLSDGQDSPIETDTAIEETEAKENITELEEVVDYYKEENKNKAPPTFEITKIEDLDQCKKRSKFKVFGKFSEDISEELKFDLPLTFPSSKIKCKVIEAKKDEEVELECKVLKEFTKVKNFVFEQRTLKKRNKEVVLVKSYSYGLGSEKKCVNYNKLRLEKSRKRQKLNFSFLQVNNFKPKNNLVNFFMAIILKQRVQVTTITISIKVSIRVTSSLRGLAEGVESLLLPVNCNLDSSTDSAAGLNCASNTATKGEPLGMLIDPDDTDTIAGVPENANPALSKGLDYSNKVNLDTLKDIPTVSITNVNGNDCSTKGSYVIEGTYDKGELKDASNIVIPFSTVESSGLCKLKVDENKKTITLNCENKEQFDLTTIGFEPMSIKDADGNLLFNLNSYTSPQQFGCVISFNSVPAKTSEPSSTTGPSNPNVPGGDPGSSNGSKSFNKASRKESSGGLSGGAIAAIIICAIIILAIIGVLIGLAKSGKIFGTKPPVQNINTSSSLNNFAYNPQPNEF